uniref:Secretory peptide n=1 Tax=Heteropoda venatoria TaxID=152925 RepID=A0A088BP78_HETVE|nr:secretory peptide [Heteropoda venatoria]
MKSSVAIILFATLLMFSIVEFTRSEEGSSEEFVQERGFCAEKGIKCHDLHCCTGLICKTEGSSKVCRKK